MNSSTQIANKVSGVSIAINLVLSLFKMLAGIFAHSAAMVSDAIHSASDVFSTFAVIIGVNISARAEDKGHQYGHERIEAVFAMLLAEILLVTGIWIGWGGIQKIISGDYAHLAVPGTLALSAAIVSILIKEGMYHYTVINAKKINSPALMADAWHHRSDALSSVGSFAGILFARLGFPICDPIASVIICLFILKASIDIFLTSVDQLIDKACDAETERLIEETAKSIDGVLTIDDLKTRLFGSKMYVDMEIGADGSLTLYDAHEIAGLVHDKIEAAFPEVKHCMIHINPKNKDGCDMETNAADTLNL